MTEKTITNVAYKCHHCHQTTYMQILGNVPWTVYSGDEQDDDAEYPTFYPSLGEFWEILLCPNCGNKNIFHGTLIDDVFDDGEIIYPPAITYEAPDDIDRQFRAAIGVSHVNPAAAVNQFRVILEMIWQESIPKGTAKPRSLRGNSGMIQQLVDNHILAGIYADMADVLASIGNAGSHNDEVEVTKEDAEKARKLCQIILEHVYRMRPAGSDLIQRLESKFPRDAGWRDGKYIDKANW